MSQNDMIIANQGFAAFRSDLNSALQALASSSKGATAPSTKYAGQLWINDTATPWVLNVWDGAQWIVLAEINASTNVGVPWGAVGSRVVAKSAGYTVVVADRGEIHTQSGTYTVVLPPAASAGDGWSITLMNIGTGEITIDGNAAETINGAATLAMPFQYGAFHLICDGSSWVSAQPARPAFLAFNSAQDANVTGDGTAATVDFDTEVFDDNGDFASDTFTAPATGRYQLSCSVRASGFLSAMTSGQVRIVTSNRSYIVYQGNPNRYADDGSPTVANISGTVLADMDAGDTATVTLTVSNSTKTVDIDGNASDMQTWFAGHLVS